MAIVIRLLGPIEALVDGVPVELGSPQQRTLLALLALHAGEAVSPDAIEQALWAETPPPSAHKVVQTYVSRLRRVLGAASIRFAGRGYSLGPGIEVDARTFRELVDQGRFEEALTLCRGTPLADVPALRLEARRLEELRVSALEEHLDGELGRGEGAALVPELESLVADHPTRERLLGQLVLALYRSGRQADALAAYRHGREALVEQLGIEPGAQLRELERRILQQDPALLPAVPAGRPAVRRRSPRRLVLAGLLVAAVGIATAVSAIAFGHGGQAVVQIRPDLLLRLDPQTNRLVGSIPIGRDEAALDATADALWLASERERTVSRLDLATDRLTTIGEPHPVAFLAHDDHGNMYASGWNFPFVWQIDPHTVQIVRSFRIGTRAALGLSSGGGSLWVVDRNANAVTRIDLAQHRVAQTFRVGAVPLASAFGYGALWVANGDSGTVVEIRPGAPRAVVRDIPSPFAISAAAGGIWVASNGMHAVYRIDPDTHAIVARIVLGTPTDFLYGVTAGPHGVWAVEDHHVVRIDPATDRVVARIRFPAGTEPKAVAETSRFVWIAVGNPKDDM